MTKSYFGDNLYALRKQKGLSQDEFASKMGVSRQAISKWERNESYPDTENLIAISRFFNISIDDLINKSIDDSMGEESSSTNDHMVISDQENNDDNKDYGDNDYDETNTYNKLATSLLINLPYPIIITIAYLLLGFLTDDGWMIGWTLYVTIPIYYSVIDCIKRKRVTPFNYPVFTTFIFLLLGMAFHIWHPLWIIFLTIPAYYPIAAAIDRAIKGNK